MNIGEYYYELVNKYAKGKFPNSFLNYVKNNYLWLLDYYGTIYPSKVVFNKLPNNSLVSMIAMQDFESKNNDYLYFPIGKIVEREKDLYIFTIMTTTGKSYDVIVTPIQGVSSGGSGTTPIDINYTNVNPTPVAIGGIPSGSTFDAKSMQEMWDMLLYPYQEPTISVFLIGKTQLEVGETLNTPLTITWKTTNHNNIKDGTVKFTFNNTDISKPNMPKSGTDTFDITPITNNTQTSIRASMEITTDKNKKITKHQDIVWLNNIYYGCIDKQIPTEQDILSLQKLNANSPSRRYDYPTGGYKYICIPSSWSDLTSFVDPATNFDVPMIKLDNIRITSALYNVVQDYKVWRSVNLLNGSISINIK